MSTGRETGRRQSQEESGERAPSGGGGSYDGCAEAGMRGKCGDMQVTGGGDWRQASRAAARSFTVDGGTDAGGDAKDDGGQDEREERGRKEGEWGRRSLSRDGGDERTTTGADKRWPVVSFALGCRPRTGARLRPRRGLRLANPQAHSGPPPSVMTKRYSPDDPQMSCHPDCPPNPSCASCMLARCSELCRPRATRMAAAAAGKRSSRTGLARATRRR